MRFGKTLLCIALAMLVTGSALAQGVSGALAGTVTQEGNPLPGVTVTLSSPNLQGTRQTVTNDSGGYSFGALPPGDYTVVFDLAGLQPGTRRVTVGLSQTARLDASMQLSSVAEAITVTATSTAVAETTEVQTNLRQDLIEDLPINRNITAITGLAPGVVAGVNGFQISGAMSFDNLYTVNGAVIQENLRGQPHNLFIEDAIQETTVQTAGVSAEFGNFTGGVVNAITKSGGNEFDGSIRDSLTTPRWTSLSRDIYTLNSQGEPTATPATDPLDQVNQVYEATLGGRIIRDRLWFFLAGRMSENESERFFSNSTNTYIATTNDERLEAKLTGSITSRHQLVASYMDAPVTQANNCQLGCFDLESVDPFVGFPNNFLSAFYNGVITNNFLVEAQYSEVNFEFDSLGGDDTDLYTGTPIQLAAPGFNTWTNAPYFCGTCTTDVRNNDTLNLTASYYLGTRSLGTHSFRFGTQRWHEVRHSDNFQTPTGFYIVSRSRAPLRDENGQTLVSLVPLTASGALRDYAWYAPIEIRSQGSDLNNTAYFLNDQWDVNNQLTLNLGVRMDSNNSKDAGGNTVTDDSNISPRLGISYDLFGNGRLRAFGSYGTYVGRLAETVASMGTGAGTSSFFAYAYDGPELLNVAPAVAAQAFFEWFNANGGTTRPLLAASVPGFSTRLAGKLKTPNVDEWTIGASTQIGRGFLRLDYINRDWNDFYLGDINTGIGKVTNDLGQTFDLLLIRNGNDLERTYEAVQLQGQYRFSGRFGVGGNYTWSETLGNVTGESSGGGPFASISANYYPEYNGMGNLNAWRLPQGYLSTDQTHKARAWATYDLDTFLGNFNFSALQRFDSGTPYSLVGSIDIRQSNNFYGPGLAGGVVNPGYQTPPTSVSYFFSEAGEFRFEDQMATDLAVNYSTNPGWLAGVQMFIQGELINAFDQQAVTSTNTSVLTHLNDNTLQRFNPMAGDVPVEGVHWRKGPLFGLPTSAASATAVGSFQLPRTYRVSVGLRF